MDDFFKKHLKGDRVVWTIFVFLCVISIIQSYSATSVLAHKATSHSAPIIQHVMFLLSGAVLAFLIHLVPYKFVRAFSYLVLLGAFGLLLYVQFRGIIVNGASRWVVIFGIRFQPSELAKLSLIIVAADLIARMKNSANKKNKIFYWLIGVVGLIVGLIVIENISTAMMLSLVILSMMFIGKVDMKKIAGIIGFVLVVVLLIGAFTMIFEQTDKTPKMLKRFYTGKSRIEQFIKGSDESKFVITDKNYQLQHGRIAVARGGVVGVFPGNSIERDNLPHAFDDFIYSIIIEEMGLLGGVFVIALFMWLLFRTGQIATVCRSTFPALLVTGLGLMVTLQALVNMIVGSGVGIVTGQPLPLISRGGTSIIITSIYFGIILGIIREIKEEEKGIYIVDSLEKDENVVELEEI
jgi:cell division protein FtsW